MTKSESDSCLKLSASSASSQDADATIGHDTAAHDPSTTQRGHTHTPDFTAALGLPSIPGYQILGELGRGGMGVVYKARQTDLNRLVALKMILSGAYAGADQLKRFQIEAETIAQLRHPNIVQVIEIGQESGRPYFSLEYVEGGSLADRLNGAPMAASSAAALTETLAWAVHAAHQRGIIHRDLKPANVLLTADGSPKITDFGLAKRLNVEKGQTASGEVLGTPSYMAPEQAKGQPGGVTILVDVYSLGAILFELLTGRPPFRGASSVETLLEVMEHVPIAPQVLNPEVDLDLATICLKCLSKDPAQRYPTAFELAEELARWQAGEPIRARQPSFYELARSLTRRHGRSAAWVFSIGMIGGLIAGLHTFTTDVQGPLMWNASAYAALPSAHRPWLATLGVIPKWAELSLGIALLLWLGLFGFLAIVAVRPRHVAADIAVGLAVGGIAGIAALSCGTGWALIYGTAISSSLFNAETQSLMEIGVKDPKEQRQEPPRLLTAEFGQPPLALPSGWQLGKYPELKGLSLDDQAALLHRKLRVELIVGIQEGIWFSLLAVGGFVLLGTAEAAAAGGLLRRHGRVRTMLPAYAEIIGPVVASVYAVIVLAVNLLNSRETFHPETWSTVLGFALAASVAGSRGWPLWARSVLQGGWILALIAILTNVWQHHTL